MSTDALIEVRGLRNALPVVLMSGYLGSTDAEADEVLQKPLSRRDFAHSLARLLKPATRGRRPAPRTGKTSSARKALQR